MVEAELVSTRKAARTDDGRLMSADEAAAFLNVHVTTVYRLVRAGAIPALKIGKQWRIHSNSLRVADEGQARYRRQVH